MQGNQSQISTWPIHVVHNHFNSNILILPFTSPQVQSGHPKSHKRTKSKSTQHGTKTE
jgi:hypothetical protein